jgi:hypothetical protein
MSRSGLMLRVAAVAVLLALVLYAALFAPIGPPPPAAQQQSVWVLGVVFTGIAHYLWPHKDGRLSFRAPLSMPAPQDVPDGARLVPPWGEPKR